MLQRPSFVSLSLHVQCVKLDVLEEVALRIVVTNDDGVLAEGLWVLAAELSKIAEVLVVAPDRDQSGTGTSVTLRHPLRVTKIKSPLDTVPAYSIEGTPADSVILAINSVSEGKKVDFVISGINEGPNIGDDVFISGTVGAALQGYFYGIKSIALSIAGFGALHFEVAAKLARILIEAIKGNHLDHPILLNVNLPNSSLCGLKGIEITELGERTYRDRIELGHDGKREYYWIMRGRSEWHPTPGTDIWALMQDKISITPLPISDSVRKQALPQQLVSQVFSRLLDEAGET